MRKMVKGNLKLDVVEHIILRNMWEYYVLSDEGKNQSFPSEPDIVYALVMGFNDEIGCVSLSEIKPHIISRTTDLSEIMPADGYEWEDTTAAYYNQQRTQTGARLHGFTGQGCPDYPLD